MTIVLPRGECSARGLVADRPGGKFEATWRKESAEPAASTPLKRPVEIACRSVEEIHSFLNRIAKTPKGSLRVYRGQDRRYLDEQGMDVLLPHLLRPKQSASYDPSWLLTAYSLSIFGITKSIGNSSLERQLVWAPALVQHYGPGSMFLDVSSDLDVALWFAQHKYSETCFVEDGEGREPQTIWRTVSYEPIDCASVNGASRVLYVFDSPIWNGLLAPKHGELVDLLKTEGVPPACIERATRLRVQHGGLLFTDERRRRRLDEQIAAVITLAPEFDGSQCRLGRATTQELFPGPLDDRMYADLLSIPLVLKFNPRRLEHRLSIPRYVNEVPPPQLETPETHSARKRHFPLLGQAANHRIPLLFESLKAGGMRDLEVCEYPFSFSETTPILLEAPMYSFSPPLDTEGIDFWLQSSLFLGVAEQIAGRSTQNVFVEFDPTDYCFLPKSGVGQPRAVWMVSGGMEMTVAYFAYNVFGGVFQKRVRFVENSDSRRWEVLGETPSEEIWKTALRCCFVVLTLLRDLSPGLKPPAMYKYSQSVRIKGERENWFFVGNLIEEQAAEPFPIPGTPFLVPRGLNGRPYARFVSGPPEAKAIDDDWEKLRLFESFFNNVREPYYLVWLGKSYAELNAYLGRLPFALTILDQTATIRNRIPFSLLDAELELLRGKVLVGMGKIDTGLLSIKRASDLALDPDIRQQALTLHERLSRRK